MPPFVLEKPFVIVESAPRKRGKTYFNLHLLPHIASEFRKIHIFTPSLRYKDDYWKEFRKDPKYVLHEKVGPEELEKVVVAQQEYVANDTRERRKLEIQQEDKRDRKRKTTIFTPAVVDYGRVKKSRKKNKRTWTQVVGNQLEYATPNKAYGFLYPDIFTGEEALLSNVRKQAKDNNERGPPLLDILIVMDDCIDEGMFDATSLGSNIAHRGRHYYTSMICSTQHLTKVAFPIRNNIDYILFWRPHSVQEQESFLEKFVSKNNVRKFRQILNRAFHSDHDFVLMDPHATRLEDKFAVGDAQNFLQGHMTPLLSTAQVNELIQ